MEVGDHLTLSCDRIVAGGSALAREPDGRIVFVQGALPHERVVARLDAVRKDRIHATAIDVLDAAPTRVGPPCRHVGDGCGGCDWQHVAVGAQGELKREIVGDALRRIARVRELTPLPAIALASEGYRTTVRCAVDDAGKLAMRRRQSHDVVVVDGCLVAHPLARDVIDRARFTAAREVTIRVGAHSGEVLVIVDGDPLAVEHLPEGIAIVGTKESAVTHFHERVGGKSLRISGGSFFQSHADAPGVLVNLVTQALHVDGGLHRVADLYCGVGLLGAFVEADSIIAVESSRASARDAKRNLAGRSAVVVCANVESADLGDCDAVIADPTRDGLGKRGVKSIVAADPDTIVLLSCEPAAGARDLRWLCDAGYDIESVQPVDQFPHTAHVEMVSVLRRRRTEIRRSHH